MPDTEFPPAPAPNSKIALILAAARTLFLRSGYGPTSMDAVAREAGVSKSTLYAHFENKEKLFSAVVGQARQDLHTALIQVDLGGDRDVAKMLKQVATRFLRYVTDQDSLTLFRVVIGESRQFPILGREMFHSSGNVLMNLFADHLRRWTTEGLLDVPDATLAAKQLFALTKSDLQFRCLLDPGMKASEADIRKNVDSAVAMFMSHYGPKG